MDGTLSFQELLNDLPQNVSTHMAKNLSVPIAFVCLLHLANEKVGCAVIITLYLQILIQILLSYLASLLSYDIYKRDDYMEFFFFQTLKIESENMSDLKITQGI